jgi:DNA invertase Pin-like site-specific DNA recombinase
MNSIKNKNPNDKKRAIIYCRVSTKEQVEEGNSLSTQEKLCREYALKNDYEIIETFIEQGESAKTTDRTELQRLLDYCRNKKNKVNAVIAYKIDRIARNIDGYSEIRIILKRHGVEIKSTSENFEDTPSGRFMENMIANVAQFDNDVRTERSINGMRDAMREGRYVWMAPIGYDNIKFGGKSTIAPNKTMGKLVAKTFSLIAQDTQNIEGVRKKMTSEGLLNKTGKPLSKSYFYALLRNELYTGSIVKFGERHKGHFQPLVSDTVFQLVQSALKKRTRRNSHYLTSNPDFPLRRFVQHTSGSLLTGSWSKGRNAKYAYYRFLMNGCSYAKDKMEKQFYEFMNKDSLDERALENYKQLFQKRYMRAIKNEREVLDHLKYKASLIMDEIYNLNNKHSKGLISDQILKMQSERLEGELNEINTQIYNEPETPIDEKEIFDFVYEYLKNPGKIWLKAPYPQKIKLQWFQFPKGITFNGEKFGTAELSFISKLKCVFLPYLSSIVHPKNHNTNHCNKDVSLEERLQWDLLYKELINLNTILKEEVTN